MSKGDKEKDGPVFDPIDGLEVEKVGSWAVSDKHELLRQYVALASGARARYLDRAGCCLIDLFCSFGRVVDRDSGVISDGGSLVAWKTSQEKGTPFSRVILGDLDSDRLQVCRQRLEAAGATTLPLEGAAEKTVDEVMRTVNRAGLHLAYLDPYNFDSLPFTIIEALSALTRVDFIIHFSTQDLQRNLGKFSASDDSALDRFAPGWRNAQAVATQRQQRQWVFEYWLGLITAKGFKAGVVRHVKGGNNQTLYYLVYLSRHPLGLKLWSVTEKNKPQRDLF